MCYSCAMMSPNDTLLEEKEGADVDGTDRESNGREELLSLSTVT